MPSESRNKNGPSVCRARAVEATPNPTKERLTMKTIVHEAPSDAIGQAAGAVSEKPARRCMLDAHQLEDILESLLTGCYALAEIDRVTSAVAGARALGQAVERGLVPLEPTGDPATMCEMLDAARTVLMELRAVKA